MVTNSLRESCKDYDKGKWLGRVGGVTKQPRQEASDVWAFQLTKQQTPVIHEMRSISFLADRGLLVNSQVFVRLAIRSIRASWWNMQGSVRVVLSFPSRPQLLQGQMTCIYMYIYKSLHTYQFRSTFIPQEIAKTAPRTSLLRFACILHISYTKWPYPFQCFISTKTCIYVVVSFISSPQSHRFSESPCGWHLHVLWVLTRAWRLFTGGIYARTQHAPSTKRMRKHVI